MDGEPTTARIVAPLALGYLVLGMLGLMLAIPPGYASPVFPAAGLALAALLRFGWRALPGVFAGSFLLNLWNAVIGGTLSPATAGVAAVIAVGASAQAAAGRALVLRGLGAAWQEMEREQDAVSFLALGGVLAGVVSASVSTMGLVAAGVISRAELGFSWWTWYVGDVLGVLVFAPLTLCFLAGNDRFWKERRARIAGPMVVALGIVAIAFHGASRWEAEAEREQLDNDASQLSRQIGDRIIAQREVLAALRNFMEATPAPSFSQFEHFTRLTLRDNPEIFALSYNDIVPAERRRAYEEAMSRLSPLGPFRITERDAERRLVPAGDRPEHVAVRYIVPLEGNRPAVGFDIQSEPVRREAIAQARASGGMAVTAPIRLVQEQKERTGVLELLPAVGVSMPGGVAEPRIAGFAVAVVKLDEMVDAATRGRVPAGLAFELTDPDAPADRRTLYRSPGWAPEAGGARGASTWDGSLRIGQQTWLLRVAISQGHLQTHRPWVAWAVGVVGLLFATLFQVLLLGATGRTAVIERKNEALRESEERYLRLFDESPLPTWVYDAQTLEFLMVNDRAVAHYGWSRAEFLRMRLPDLYPKGEPTPEPPEVAGREVREARHAVRDGRCIDVVVTASPYRAGEVEACLEIVRDVTQERADQARLRLADTVFENAGSSMVVTDVNAVALSVNPAFTRMTGYSAREVIGQNLRILQSGRHPPEFFQAMWRKLLTEHRWQGEIWNRRRSGEHYLEWLTITAVRDAEGRTTRYVGSFIDITEQRALEEKLATASRLAAMGTLVAGVAHEINNPLAGAMGAQGTAAESVEDLRALARQGLPLDPGQVGPQLDDLAEALRDAQAGTARIARIVKDLSLLGRPDAQRARIRLSAVVEEAMRWLPASVARSAAIVVEEAEAPEVEASAGQLAQVVINLVTNAAKAVPRGRQGRVVVRIGTGEHGAARLEVADDGVGMSAEVVRRIFDPFYTTRQPGEGTGLGLPICHSIVTAHGGSITVESVPGKGTTFRVELPSASAQG